MCKRRLRRNSIVSLAVDVCLPALTRELYIDAIVKETHRWHPVAPMALPHSSTQEDVINGYRIPKGSLLLPNNWYTTPHPTIV
jgi:cytochrome P450